MSYKYVFPEGCSQSYQCFSNVSLVVLQWGIRLQWVVSADNQFSPVPKPISAQPLGI